MSTFSVYNIKVDNSLSFTPGPTAGYILAIGSEGVTYWTSVVGPTGPQGIQGETGSQGIQGIQGIQGETGATGPQGSSGLTYSQNTGYVTSWSGTNTLGTSSILLSNGDISVYQNTVTTATISGIYNQSLVGHSYVYNLSANATFSFTNAKNATYNFLVNAGSFVFTLGTGSFKTQGATALGYTGSFVMSGIYDGSRMWIATPITNFQDR